MPGADQGSEHQCILQLTKEGTATVSEVKKTERRLSNIGSAPMPIVPGTNESDWLMNDGGDATFLTQWYRAGVRLGQGRIIARPTEQHELRVRVHLAVD